MNEAQARQILEFYSEVKGVELYIKENFKRQEGSRIRRGEVSNEIFKALNLHPNPINYTKIKTAMLKLGIRYIKVDGKLYFGELSRK